VHVLAEAGNVIEHHHPTPAQLLDLVRRVDALVVRSRTKVSSQVVEAGRDLRVIARAGAGVDNIDLEAATRRGILVVNAPGANTVAVAEHTMALILALARRIPEADASMHAGRWEKGRLQGTELMGKVLGLIGLGRIGSAVAQRALAFGMEVLAYDPFVSVAHAEALRVRLADLDEVLRQADFLSVHAPATPQTRRLIGAAELAKMKPTARIVNCARGGIVDEAALGQALREGRLAGAALDVFEEEPPTRSPLLDAPNVILTPHLAGSTLEAQRKVGMSAAEDVVRVLRGEPPRHPVNAPFLAPEVLESLYPYVELCQRLGRLYAQLAGDHLESLEITYSGDLANQDTTALRAALLAGLLEQVSEEPVNLVNAPLLARSRGLAVEERKTPATEHFTSQVTLRARTTAGERTLAGTVIRGEPHVVEVDGYHLDFVARGHLLVSEHIEGPGILGRVGTLLGEAGINISFVQVGRKARGGLGLMVLGLDEPPTQEVLGRMMELPTIRSVRVAVLNG
ncbi:MAG: phosphoglycerate dehydrogenase, partial [Anaerolineae bacterium]|nr:phosphoglycerate dehydrogenase [Anaerolineae bacterium]